MAMMKKNILGMVLSLLLVATMLAGCGDVSETPTDANSPATQQTGGAESLVASQPTQEENKTPAVQSTPAPTTSKETGKEESTVSNNKENTNDQPQGDEPWSPPPGFTSVEGFHSWLQTGGVEEEKRADLLGNVKNSTTYSATAYCRPKLGNGNEWFTLSEIRAYPYSVVYEYSFFKKPKERGLKITTYIDPIYMADGARSMKERYDLINNPEERVFDKYGSATVNQITYYYYHYPANDSTTIDWRINGNTFKAKYYGDYAQINEILPLLELEQVGYKVTKSEAKRS